MSATGSAFVASDLKRAPMTHALKTWPQYFGDIVAGVKSFEVRRADRDFRVGDLLELREYEPNLGETDGGHFTGKACTVEVSYLLEGDSLSLPSGYVYMGIKKPDTAVRPLGWEENARLQDRVAKLQAFKDFVHNRLDQMGVPMEFPEGGHSKEGCRVGDRLDWIEQRAVDAEARVEPYARELQAIGKALGHVGTIKLTGLSLCVGHAMEERAAFRDRAKQAEKRQVAPAEKGSEFNREMGKIFNALEETLAADPKASAYDRARCAAETQLRIDGYGGDDGQKLARAIGRAIEAAR